MLVLWCLSKSLDHVGNTQVSMMKFLMMLGHWGLLNVLEVSLDLGSLTLFTGINFEMYDFDWSLEQRQLSSAVSQQLSRWLQL